MAWLTGWNYRRLLKTDHNKIDADCSDFPVKVIFDEGNFAFAHALETGNDVRFTASDGETLLKYEREIHGIIDWGKFVGTVDGTYDTYNDSNADYLALRFHRRGAMNKYAELDNSIDASSDFVFSYKLYVTGIVMGSSPTYGSVGCIGLSDNTTNANNHYVGADIVYDADTSTKAYVSSRFEGTSPYKGSGFAYSDGIELNTETTYIIKLSKTGSTLKVAVCNASDEELWSDTATASTTPTLTYLKIWDYTPGYGSPYVDFRLSDFYNGSTEETFTLKSAVYHVKLPTASSTSDTEFYCYYGKSDASDGADGENVWDSNYALVHHMGADCLDSTSNDNDGTNSGTTLGLVRGGYCRRFSGSSQYITYPTLGIFDGTGQFTFELHYNQSVGGTQQIISAYGENQLQIQTGENQNANILHARANVSSTWSDYVIASAHDYGTWYVASISYHPTSGWVLARGGASLDTDASTGAISTRDRYNVIGARRDTSAFDRFYNGLLSEVRISSTARSLAWHKATYHSLADTLLTYGAEEALTPTARPRVMVVWA